jgi:molybdate transport system substrate-binding protein
MNCEESPVSRRPLRAAAAAILTLVLSQAGLVRGAEPNLSGEVTVSAAASLTSAFQQIARDFETAHPGVVLRTNFAGSPTLVQQIQEGAPVDVFASADEPSMQRLIDAGEIAGTPRIFARNQLAVVVPKGNPERVSGLADLTKPGLVLSLCGPAVPAGRYAREAFRKAGLTVPETSQELDVKAVVSRVVLGEADAGVVYVTDARAAGDKVEGIAIPEASNVLARYPIAVLKDAPNRAAADAFVAYVLGASGRTTLENFGFLAP